MLLYIGRISIFAGRFQTNWGHLLYLRLKIRIEVPKTKAYPTLNRRSIISFYSFGWGWQCSGAITKIHFSQIRCKNIKFTSFFPGTENEGTAHFSFLLFSQSFIHSLFPTHCLYLFAPNHNFNATLFCEFSVYFWSYETGSRRFDSNALWLWLSMLLFSVRH